MFDLNLSLQRGPARLRISRDDADRLTQDGVLVVDDRRRRPQWFDGRFLAARDLTNEQNYFLTRQADLGKAGGFGVVSGLAVLPDPRGFRITPGHGITSLGEVVVIPDALRVQLNNVPQIQRLDRAFGLFKRPALPSRTLSGLFIVALRAVEYTANPIVSYPTAVEGERSAEDGDIIEATAVTLIPYGDGATNLELNQRRADVAYAMFVENAGRDLPVGTLPLAMIAINRGVVQWIDPYLVRREVGAEHSDVLGLGAALGLTSRATREAHLLHYDEHLEDILAGGDGRSFSAADYFRVLPPAGRLPRFAVNPNDFTQTYFPQGVQVDLSIVPVDELGVMIEESLVLPPIDLTLSAEQLESTSVQIIIPITRRELRQRISRLESNTRFLRPAAPGLVAARKPLEALRALRLPRRPIPPILDPASLADREWQDALASADTLWYVRRRNFHYKAEIVGTTVPLVIEGGDGNGNGGDGGNAGGGGAVAANENRVLSAIEELNLPGFYRGRFNVLREAATGSGTWPEIVATLTEETFLTEPFLLAGIIHELSLVGLGPVGTSDEVVERYIEMGGEGYRVLRNERSDVLPEYEPEFLPLLPRFLMVPEIDRLILEQAEAGDLDSIGDFLDDRGNALREGSESAVDAFQALIERLEEQGIEARVTDPANIPFFSGSGVVPPVDRPIEDEEALRERLESEGLTALFDEVSERAVSRQAEQAAVELLMQDIVARSPQVLSGAVHELAALERIDVAAVREVAGRYTARDFGSGLERFADATRGDRELLTRIADVVATSGWLSLVDRFMTRRGPDTDEFAKRVITMILSGETDDAVHALIKEVLTGAGLL